MLLATLFLLNGVAGAVEPGLALGLTGQRGSDGLHRVWPSLSVYVQHRTGWEGLFLEAECLASRRTELVPSGAMTTAFLRPAFLVGWEGGSQAAQVHGALGPAATGLLGGLEGDQSWWRGGLRGRWGVTVSHGEHLLLGATLGGALRGRGGDMDLLLRAGWNL